MDTPDERSVITYVAEFFHKFSSEDKMETGARRVEKFAELMQGIWCVPLALLSAAITDEQDEQERL